MTAKAARRPRKTARRKKTLEAAELVITAKFQCGWYQYVQRWEFNSYGEIHADLGMGGELHPINPDKGHVHHMYFGGEESIFLPYHYEGFHITPLAFAKFRPPARQPNPERPPEGGH
jgi:hypothetical protein